MFIENLKICISLKKKHFLDIIFTTNYFGFLSIILPFLYTEWVRLEPIKIKNHLVKYTASYSYILFHKLMCNLNIDLLFICFENLKSAIQIFHFHIRKKI